MEEFRYKVVVNHEEQYALWIAGKNNAPGWCDTGIEGLKADCLSWVNMVWTDMRPLSLRRSQHTCNTTAPVSEVHGAFA